VDKPKIEHPWGAGCDGLFERFYTCGLCGAAVMQGDCPQHEEWHVWLANVAAGASYARMLRPIGG
jgi:hypothetical protein